MKRFYIITFIMLVAFSVPGTGHGEFILIDHGRSVIANGDQDFFSYLSPYIISIDGTGTSGDYASASQESYFIYTYRKSIKLAAKGSTHIEGDNSYAESWVRVDFFVSDEPMECHLNYDLTGGGIIYLSKGESSPPDSWKTFSGTKKEKVSLEAGRYYRLFVNSSNIGTFNTCVSVLPLSDGEPLEDSDRDCISDDQDNCPNIANTGQEDKNEDGVGDVCERPKAMPGIPLLLLDTENFILESSSFSHAQPIPSKHSLNGNNLSPPLFWRNAPANTQSFVLIMDDPDAPGGTWDHWIVYDIPSGTTSLAENAGASGGGNLPPGAKHGTNSWSNNYYQGPSPPSGTHRYYFKLYALNTLQLNPSGTSKVSIEAAMQGKILKQTELMGTYTHTP